MGTLAARVTTLYYEVGIGVAHLASPDVVAPRCAAWNLKCWLTRAVNGAQVRGHCERFDCRVHRARYWSRLSLAARSVMHPPPSVPIRYYFCILRLCWVMLEAKGDGC